MKKNTFKILLGSLFMVGITSCETDDSSIVEGMPDAVVNTDGANAPARGFNENWFGHEESLNRQYYETNVAVYYDDYVDRAIDWPFLFTQNVWDNAISAYNNVGNNILYAVFHTGVTDRAEFLTDFESDVNGGVIDIPLNDAEMEEEKTTLIISQIGKLVEYSAKGVEGSPAEDLWMDEFNKIFVYDTYLNIDMEAEATTVKDRYSTTQINGVYWFRDWFLPVYETYGKTSFLNNFYNIASQNFPKDGDRYARSMNLGEFVHFMSGAAGEDLQPIAESAFNWTEDVENELLQARVSFPDLAYPFEAVSQLRDVTVGASITVSKENGSGAGANEGSPKLIDNDTNSKYLTGNVQNIIGESDFWLQQQLTAPEPVNKYTLTSGNDAPSRDPNAWQLLGSNDGTNWTVLDEKSNVTFSDRNQTREFDFDNDISYLYYRLNITGYNGDYNFQLSEWRLLVLETLTAPEPVDYTVNATITVNNENTSNPDETSASLIDGDTNSKYLAFDFESGLWMQQELPEAKIVVRYTLTSGDDAPSRDPASWTISGSNDGENWDELDSRTDQSFESRNKTKEFNFSNDTAYTYYKLTVLDIYGDSSIFQMSEWRLIGLE